MSHKISRDLKSILQKPSTGFSSMVSIAVWQFCLVYVAGASILAVACHKAVTGSFNLVQVTCPPLSAACYSLALFSGYHSIQLPSLRTSTYPINHPLSF